MKIYCAKRYQTEEELLEHLAGTDAWARTFCVRDSSGHIGFEGYIKIKEIVGDKLYGDYFTVQYDSAGKPYDAEIEENYSMWICRFGTLNKPYEFRTDEEIQYIIDRSKR